MKYILSILLISFALNASAELTHEEENVVIAELNNYCADSWCESAIEFNFKEIKCSDSTATCDLYFTTQNNSTQDQPVFVQMCEVKPFTRFEQMVVDQAVFESGAITAATLKDGFVDQVDRCAEKFFH
ncbi:MAG: hypothetical protein H7256_03775 [Bdellovibrio sp.]|nr:hypothetical protein [Bdellovibrio sp.]